MRFKDILLENVVLNATKPVLVPGDVEATNVAQHLGLDNSLEDWAHKRYSKWIIQVKEANPEWRDFIGSESVRTWYMGILVKYILKDKEGKFLLVAPTQLTLTQIPHKDEIKGLTWAIDNGELNQIRYFPADDGKIHQDLRNQLEEAEHFFTSLMSDIYGQAHIPGNSDEATTKQLMQVHQQQKKNAEKLLKNLARSPMEQLLQQWAKYNQTRPTIKSEQIQDQTKVYEQGKVSFWKLESENAFKAIGSALKNCIGSIYHFKPDEYDMYVLRDKGTEQAAICIQTNPDAGSGYYGGRKRQGEVPAVRENKGYNNRPTPAVYTDELIDFFKKVGVKGVMGAGQRDNHSMGLMFDKDGFKNIRKEYPLNKTNITYKLDDIYTVALPSNELIKKVISTGQDLGINRIHQRTAYKRGEKDDVTELVRTLREQEDALTSQFETYSQFVSRHMHSYKLKEWITRWADDRAVPGLDLDKQGPGVVSHMRAELAKGINDYLDNNFYTILDSKDRLIIDFHLDDNKNIEKWNILIDSRQPFLNHVKHLHDAGLVAGVNKDIEREWLERHGVVKGKKGAYHPYMEKYAPKKIKESGNYTLWRHTGSPGKVDEYWDVNDKKEEGGVPYNKQKFKSVAEDQRSRYGDNGLIKMRFYYIGDSSGRPMIALGVGDQKLATDYWSRKKAEQGVKNILGAILVARKPKIRSDADDNHSNLIDDPDPERGIVWQEISRSSDLVEVQDALNEFLPFDGKIDHLQEKFRKLAYMLGWADTVEKTINADIDQGWRNARSNILSKRSTTHLGINSITSNKAFETLKPTTQKRLVGSFMKDQKDLMPLYQITSHGRYSQLKYGTAGGNHPGSDYKKVFLQNVTTFDPERQGQEINVGMNYLKDNKDQHGHDEGWDNFSNWYGVKKEVYNQKINLLDKLWPNLQKEIEKLPAAKVQFGQQFATIFAPQIQNWKDKWYVPFIKNLDDKQILSSIATILDPSLGDLDFKVEKEFGISSERGPRQEFESLKGKDLLAWLTMAREHAMGDVYGPVGPKEAQRYNKAMKAWHMGIGGTKHEGPEPGSEANLIEPEAMLKLLIKNFKEDYLPKLITPREFKHQFGSQGRSFKSRVTIANIDNVTELRTYTMGQDEIEDPTYFMGYKNWADRSGEQYLIAKELQKRNPQMDIPGITPEMREKMLADNT